MSWRDRLVNASYKNIPFKVRDHTYNSGRRTELHQFANREKPYLEDLGLEAETFNLEVYVIQNILNEDDYFTERDNLIRVLKQKGSGTLIHPFLGIKKVGCTGFTLSESFEEGGIARFSVNFTEAGERALPQNITDFFSAVDNAVNQAFDLVGDAFYKGYEVVSLFQNSVSNIISRSIGTVTTGLSATAGIATKIISEAVGNVSFIRNQVNEIIGSPNNIYNALKNSALSMASVCGMSTILLLEQTAKGYATDNGVAIADKSEDIFANRLSLSTNITGGETGQYSGVARGDVVELDPNSIEQTLGISVINNIINMVDNYDMSGLSNSPPEQQKNIALIIDVTKFLLIGTACRIAIRINFFSQEELITYMEKINELIDRFLIDLGDEGADGTSAVGIGTGTEPIDNIDIFLSLQDIRKSFTDNMIRKSSSISKTIDYTIPIEIQTTLQLAYDRYEDLDRSREIFRKNKLLFNNPGFLPPNDTIRILDV